jgi:hypothetical protein
MGRPRPRSNTCSSTQSVRTINLTLADNCSRTRPATVEAIAMATKMARMN